MSEKSDFYVTLMSDSSFNVHPENTTASFTVTLPKDIVVDDSWEVAATEVHYPQTVQNMMDGYNNFEIIVKHSSETTLVSKYSIPPGYYNSLRELIMTMNDLVQKTFQEDQHVLFLFRNDKLEPNFSKETHEKFMKRLKIFMDDQISRKPPEKLKALNLTVEHAQRVLSKIEARRLITISDGNAQESDLDFDDEPVVGIVSIQAKLHPRLALQLGVDEIIDLDGIIEKRNTPDLKYGISPNMLIYCDLVEPQIIGDTWSQVIRVLKTTEKGAQFGDLTVKSFNVLNYMGILKRAFRDIKVDIRAHTGELLPFMFGTSSITLHFRKKQVKI